MFTEAGFTMQQMKGIHPWYGWVMPAWWPLGLLLVLLSLGYFADSFYQQYACIAGLDDRE